MVNDLPQKDSSIFLLNDQYLDKAYDVGEMEVLSKKTNLHKLSYKYKHNSAVDEKLTFWGALLDES